MRRLARQVEGGCLARQAEFVEQVETGSGSTAAESPVVVSLAAHGFQLSLS